MTRILALLLAVVLLAAAAPAQFTVTGAFEYEDKAWGYGGWTGGDNAIPIRRADVTVLDDSSSIVLGTGSTLDDGSFAIACASAGVTDIVVRVNADTNLNGSFQRIRVTTTANVEYSAFSPVFANHDTSTDLDVGTTTVVKSVSNGDEGNPFNLLDMGVAAWEYITGPRVGANAVGSTVRLNWPGGSGSFASGATVTMAEDDGYDDAVILHELGHVVHNLYSDSDSPGGSHFFGDSNQDPRLSFGEGYATFFGGVVMITSLGRQALYVDANGSSQTGGVQLRLRLETVAPYGNDCYGAADEVAVAATLFDILDDEDSPDQSTGVDDDPFVSTTMVGSRGPHEAWWDVFTGPVDAVSNVTINDAWNGWFSEHGADGLHSDLRALYDIRNLHFFNDVDEPNDVLATPLPISVSNSWSGNRTLYTGSGVPPSPGTNDRDWYEIDVVIGSRLDIETRYPGNSSDADTQVDTELSIWDPAGVKLFETDSGGTGRNAKISDYLVTETGAWKFRVRSVHDYREYGRYNYRCRYVHQNFRPEITVGPVALPGTIAGGSSTMLTATASDANAGQTLAYEWTPLAGGSIAGTGSSVSFHSLPVGSPTEVDVQLVVVDDLGAVSDPAIVTIELLPPVIMSGRVMGKPYTGGPPGPLGSTGVAPNLGSVAPGTVLIWGPVVEDMLPATALVGREITRGRLRPDVASPLPEQVVAVVPTPAGRLELALPEASVPADGEPLYVQFVRPDRTRGGALAWSTVLELTRTD